jgi:hypothetical protein
MRRKVDGVGHVRSRSTGETGGNDKRNNTLGGLIKQGGGKRVEVVNLESTKEFNMSKAFFKINRQHRQKQNINHTSLKSEGYGSVVKTHTSEASKDDKIVSALLQKTNVIRSISKDDAINGTDTAVKIGQIANMFAYKQLGVSANWSRFCELQKKKLDNMVDIMRNSWMTNHLVDKEGKNADQNVYNLQVLIECLGKWEKEYEAFTRELVAEIKEKEVSSHISDVIRSKKLLTEAVLKMLENIEEDTRFDELKVVRTYDWEHMKIKQKTVEVLLSKQIGSTWLQPLLRLNDRIKMNADNMVRMIRLARNEATANKELATKLKEANEEILKSVFTNHTDKVMNATKEVMEQVANFKASEKSIKRAFTAK